MRLRCRLAATIFLLAAFGGTERLIFYFCMNRFSREDASKCIAGRVGTPQALASSRQLPFQGRQDIKAEQAISHISKEIPGRSPG